MTYEFIEKSDDEKLLYVLIPQNKKASTSDPEEQYYIGVDVGTSSVRAALVNRNGEIITVATNSIHIFEPQDDMFEQSSDNIWLACSTVIQAVHEGIEKHQICGIGFDATCSLVVLGKDFNPISVSPSGDSQWNVIMWMDHRASEQAERINATKHNVLKYVGGKISLEMQIPKLLWLKEHMKSCWDKAAYLMDLPDFLTWKASGSLSRSLCSVVCKWTYICGKESNNISLGWDTEFFKAVGLEDVSENGFQKIGSTMQQPGEACGQGLTKAAAQQLGLTEALPVATSIIDAHAGGLGSLCCNSDEIETFPVKNRMAIICGTSTCHMAVAPEPVFVPGVWGPYYSAMIPDMWLNEGGQSAAGVLIDSIIENHPAFPWIKDTASSKKQHMHEVLNDILLFMVNKSSSVKSVTKLTHDYHVYPDFRGNRSPLADPHMKGMVCGLSLSTGAEDLALQYLAVVQGLAYSSRHIIEAMTSSGHDIKVLHACGGLSKNQLYIQTHADVTGLPVILPHEKESILLGCAILAASASANFSSLNGAMSAMGGTGKVLKPSKEYTGYHEKKYKVFLKMIQDQNTYRKIMTTQE